jgi:RNA polymerase sigma-70 factor (ECF subfamily)
MNDRTQEFEALARQHRPARARPALRLAHGDAETAQDIVQEALVRSWRRFETFTAGTNFRAWVSRIMYHLHVSRWRRQGPMPLLLGDAPVDMDQLEELSVAEDDGTPGGYVAGLLGEEVVAATDGVTREFWEATVLYAVCGLSYEEIGRATGAPPGTVKSRVFRGRRDLRVALAEWVWEEYGIVA